MEPFELFEEDTIEDPYPIDGGNWFEKAAFWFISFLALVAVMVFIGVINLFEKGANLFRRK